MLCDMKVLIVEDEEDVAQNIKEGLRLLENRDIDDRFNPENIFIYHVRKDEKNIRENIIQKITENNMDVIFIDLHLQNNSNEGISIIRGLMSDDDFTYRNIPKYIITGEEGITDRQDYKDVLQYAYIINKGTISAEAFKNKFDQNKLIYSLPILVKTFREIKKLNQQEFIFKNMQRMLESIKDDTENIRLKTDVIENMNQTMLKLFPLSTANIKKQEELKRTILEDLGVYLEEDGLDTFFEAEKRQPFLEAVTTEFNELIKKDLKKGAWDTFKDSVKVIAKNQGIDDDNAALCAAKLAYRGYNKISALISGRAEI